MRVTPGTLQDTSRPRLTASSRCFDRVIKSGEVGGGGDVVVVCRWWTGRGVGVVVVVKMSGLCFGRSAGLSMSV